MTSDNQKGIVHLAAIVILAVLGVSTVGTVAASDNAKPGDFLYPVDKAVENFRLSLANSPESEAALRLELANERLLEIKELQEEGGENATGISDAFSDLSDHKFSLNMLDDDDLNDEKHEMEQLFERNEELLEMFFETAEDTLEDEREELKYQMEDALKAGDMELAESLKLQISNIEDQLDFLEDEEKSTQKGFEEDKEESHSQFDDDKGNDEYDDLNDDESENHDQEDNEDHDSRDSEDSSDDNSSEDEQDELNEEDED